MTHMLRLFLLAILLLVTRYSYSQEKALGVFLSDTSMIHASVSLCIKDADNGEIVSEYNPEKSLTTGFNNEADNFRCCT